MKFKKWIFLFLLTLVYTGSNAQESPVFPVAGTFALQNDAGSNPKDFNKVTIGPNTFSLWMDQQVVRTYQIVTAIKGGYSVEQVVTGNAYKEKFNVTINEINSEECFFTVHYEEGSEVIHLRLLE